MICDGFFIFGVREEREGAVLDAVCVAAGDGTKVWVGLVEGVSRGVVVAGHDVEGLAVLVGDDQVGDGGAVGDEGEGEVRGVEPVFAVGVGGRDFCCCCCRKGECPQQESMETHLGDGVPILVVVMVPVGVDTRKKQVVAPVSREYRGNPTTEKGEHK